MLSDKRYTNPVYVYYLYLWWKETKIEDSKTKVDTFLFTGTSREGTFDPGLSLFWAAEDKRLKQEKLS
jgi:hypothetical protein